MICGDLLFVVDVGVWCLLCVVCLVRVVCCVFVCLLACFILFCFVLLLLLLGKRRLAILCMCGPEILCVCSPSSFVRVGILLLKGQALFIALQKKGFLHC